MDNFEQRSMERASLQNRQVRGYAAVFGSRAQLAPGIFETIAPGAFTEALAQDDVRFTVEHDPAKLLARSSAGTLMLAEDSRGLSVNAPLPDTTLGRDVAVLMDRGDLTQMSFRFRTPPKKEHWTSLADGSELRELQSLRLLDVSLVAFPAYVDSVAALRSRDEHRLIIPLRIIRTHRLLSMKEK